MLLTISYVSNDLQRIQDDPGGDLRRLSQLRMV